MVGEKWWRKASSRVGFSTMASQARAHHHSSLRARAIPTYATPKPAAATASPWNSNLWPSAISRLSPTFWQTLIPSSWSISQYTGLPHVDLVFLASSALIMHLFLEEHAEPTEELAGDDFIYSQETTSAFQELSRRLLKRVPGAADRFNCS